MRHEERRSRLGIKIAVNLIIAIPCGLRSQRRSPHDWPWKREFKFLKVN